MDALFQVLLYVYYALLLRVTGHELTKMHWPRLVIGVAFQILLLLVPVLIIRAKPLELVVVVNPKPRSLVLLDKLEEPISFVHLLVLEASLMAKESRYSLVDVNCLLILEVIGLHELILDGKQ